MWALAKVLKKSGVDGRKFHSGRMRVTKKRDGKKDLRSDKPLH